MIQLWQPNSTISACRNATGGPVSQNDNGALYNGMIAPFLNMTIFGALWYQGKAKDTLVMPRRSPRDAGALLLVSHKRIPCAAPARLQDSSSYRTLRAALDNALGRYPKRLHENGRLRKGLPPVDHRDHHKLMRQ